MRATPSITTGLPNLRLIFISRKTRMKTHVSNSLHSSEFEPVKVPTKAKGKSGLDIRLVGAVARGPVDLKSYWPP